MKIERRNFFDALFHKYPPKMVVAEVGDLFREFADALRALAKSEHGEEE